MDCFVAETMPIYYGSKAIAQFFPAESLVVLDPEDPDVFANIREVIQSDLYVRRKDAILEAKRLVLEKYNVFALVANFLRGVTTPPLPVRTLRIK